MENNYKTILNDSSYWGMTLEERLHYYRIPAFSLVLINDGKIDYTYCYGYKDRNKKDLVTNETLFQAGSISKPVFATAVMGLVQKGEIDLDKDIKEYTDVSFYKSFDNQIHTVTLRQLLSHTAGFNLHGFAGYQYGQEIPSLEQILKGIEPANNLPLFLKTEPGKEWKYSGGGYLLAQKVICDVTHKDFESIVRDEILQPFGMTYSTYHQPLDEDNRNNIAYGYDVYNLQLPNGFNTMPELAAAGLWTTPSDLAAFGIEMMKAYHGKSDFITQETMKMMLTKMIPNIPTGLGFFIPDDNPKGYFDHSGANMGYHTIMCFQAEGNKGYVAMMNADIGAGFYHELDCIISKVMDI